jgi:hypothetical protein
MIASQVAGKAVRDALFLSTFDVTALPRMVMVAAVLTIAAVLLAAKFLARFGPRPLVIAGFAGSAVLQLLIWALNERTPRLSSVLLYLHSAALGAVLISWFWSMISERFDPRTARQRIGRIAAGGTFGGLVGGIAAERAALVISLPTMLPFLAALHAVCVVAAVAIGGARAPKAAPDESSGRSGFRVLSEVKYLRHLAIFVMLGTMSVALLDYAFKVRAQAAYEDPETMLRFFSLFYAGVALVTFLVQSTLTRRALEHLGLARTVAFLPFASATGIVAALFAPGLAALGVARGAEAAVRSSLFRSGYELFYTPILRTEKRASKTLIDVGFDRLGDALGGGIAQLALLSGITAIQPLLGIAAAIALASLLVAQRLHRGYVAALEKSLLHQARARHASSEEEEALRTSFLQTVAHLDLTGEIPEVSMDASASWVMPVAETESETAEPVGDRHAIPSPPLPANPLGRLDPWMVRAIELRSGDPIRVQKALAASRTLPPELVPVVIALLAWDLAAPYAGKALRKSCDRHAGQLVDALLDSEEEFAIRRRIPRVLAHSKSDLAAQGLLAALDDRRFEVRYQAGLALAKLQARRPDFRAERAHVLSIVKRETSVDRSIWENQRLLDDGANEEDSPFASGALRGRSSRSLEHVFNLLSLVHPRQPLSIAYEGLHTTDDHLRGTAIEYLESVLSSEIREALWRLLDRKGREGYARSADETLESLLKSQDSIRINLEEIRSRAKEE